MTARLLASALAAAALAALAPAAQAKTERVSLVDGLLLGPVLVDGTTFWLETTGGGVAVESANPGVSPRRVAGPDLSPQLRRRGHRGVPPGFRGRLLRRHDPRADRQQDLERQQQVLPVRLRPLERGLPASRWRVAPHRLLPRPRRRLQPPRRAGPARSGLGGGRDHGRGVVVPAPRGRGPRDRRDAARAAGARRRAAPRRALRGLARQPGHRAEAGPRLRLAGGRRGLPDNARAPERRSRRSTSRRTEASRSCSSPAPQGAGRAG